MPKAIEKMEEVVPGLYKASERSYYILHNGDLKFCIKERLDKLLKIDGTLEMVVKNYRARGDAKAAKKEAKTEKAETKKEEAKAEKKESAKERRNRLRREARAAKKKAGKLEPNPITIIDSTPPPSEPIVVESLPAEGDTEPATTESEEQLKEVAPLVDQLSDEATKELDNSAKV